MDNERLPKHMVLSDEQVRQVIERAVRSQPKGTGISIAELRQIAAELDIDSHALEQALDQVVGLPIEGPPVRSWLKRKFNSVGRFVDRFLPQRGRLVYSVLIAGLAGWLNAFLMDFSINAHYPIAAVMIGGMLLNLLSRRPDHRFRAFVAETLGMWVVYGTAWALTFGGVTDNLVVWCVLWSSLGLLGWFVSGGRSDPAPAGIDRVAESSARDVSDPNSVLSRWRDDKRFASVVLWWKLVALAPAMRTS